jgi:predicted lactoylglutathione lyase
MDRMIFVNLPVTDLAASKAFYTGLGFSINEQFSDDQCACIVVSDTIYVMLLVEKRFKDFINGEIAPRESTETLLCLSAESRAEVDDLLRKALTHGGKPWKELMEEGPMYGGSFADPDGHVWEVLYMDMSQVNGQ